VTRGEPRSAHSCQSRCRFLPLAQICPTAIPTRVRHLWSFRPRVEWRLTSTGPRTEARTCRRAWRHEPSRRVHALLANADDVPLLGDPRGTLGHRRDRPYGKRPRRTNRTGQDPLYSDAPRRAPTSRRSGAFHRRGYEVSGGFTPADLRNRPLAHAAHTFSPSWGECLRALQARPTGETRWDASREPTPFLPAGHAWD
jgi:hypothetical protein